MDESQVPVWPAHSLGFCWQSGLGDQRLRWGLEGSLEVIWAGVYIFQTGTHKPDEGKGLPQGHAVTRQQSCNQNPGLLAPSSASCLYFAMLHLAGDKVKARPWWFLSVKTPPPILFHNHLLSCLGPQDSRKEGRREGQRLDFLPYQNLLIRSSR